MASKWKAILPDKVYERGSTRAELQRDVRLRPLKDVNPQHGLPEKPTKAVARRRSFKPELTAVGRTRKREVQSQWSNSRTTKSLPVEGFHRSTVRMVGSPSAVEKD
jgi:hypothetical protein